MDKMKRIGQEKISSHPRKSYQHYLKLYRQLKRGLKGEKGFEEVESWTDQDLLARRLAQECYEKAQECIGRRKLKEARDYMKLVHDFLRLSHLSKKELDLDEIRKRIAELREHGEKT